MLVAVLAFLFLIRLRFWQWKPVSHNNSMVTQKSRDYKNLKNDYHLQKAEIDLEFLVRCRDNNVITRFLNIRLANSLWDLPLLMRNFNQICFQRKLDKRNLMLEIWKKTLIIFYLSYNHKSIWLTILIFVQCFWKVMNLNSNQIASFNKINFITF